MYNKVAPWLALKCKAFPRMSATEFQLILMAIHMLIKATGSIESFITLWSSDFVMVRLIVIVELLTRSCYMFTKFEFEVM